MKIYFKMLLILVFLLTYLSGNKSTAQENTTPFGEVVHIGWIVKDMQKVINYWQKVGLGKFSIVESLPLNDALYRGNKINLVLKQGWITIGGVGIELLQPIKGKSVYDEFLEKHGEGIQHVAFSVNSPEELESQVTRFSTLGISVIQRGTFETKAGQGIFVYFDTEPIGGVSFELMYCPETIKNKKEGIPLPPETNQYPFTKIVQYCTVVKDIDKVAEFYNKISFTVSRIDRDNKGLIRRYKGQDEDLRMHMGWSKWGSVTLEIIQPTKGKSVYEDYLKNHGEGFHHLAFNVKDMDDAVSLFKQRGVEVNQDGAWGKTQVEGRFAYLDTDPVGGLTIELLWSKK